MTNKKIKLAILTIAISIGIGLGTNAAVKTVKPQPKATPISQQMQSAVTIEMAKPLDIVANPDKYMNKKVKIRAKFDKFTTLGLDYKPAYKNSEKFITFLIKRDDVTDHNVPLSELKNFLDRKTAEKYIELKSGDNIEYTGYVFSTALGDAWFNVESFKVLNEKPKTPVKK